MWRGVAVREGRHKCSVSAMVFFLGGGGGEEATYVHDVIGLALGTKLHLSVFLGRGVTCNI